MNVDIKRNLSILCSLVQTPWHDENTAEWAAYLADQFDRQGVPWIVQNTVAGIARQNPDWYHTRIVRVALERVAVTWPEQYERFAAVSEVMPA